MKRKQCSLIILFVTLTLLLTFVSGRVPPSTAQSQRGSPAVLASIPERAQVAQAVRSSSVMFIENVGQFDSRARFQVRGGSGTMWLAEDAIWITVLEKPSSPQPPSPRLGEGGAILPSPRFGRGAGGEGQPRKGVNLRLTFPGANPHPCIEPFDRLDTVVSYFIGNDPDQWHPDVPVWGGVRYVDLYHGVDLEVTSEGGRWTWRFAVRDSQFTISNVRLCVEGADAVELLPSPDVGRGAGGEGLHLTTALGDFTLPLFTVEDLNVERAHVERANDQTFEVSSPFSSAPPLPGTSAQTASSDLLYSTFLGESDYDTGESIAVDGSGNAYVTGVTSSSNFPVGPGYDTSFNGGYDDAFVVKLSPSGTSLLYSTFLGGSDYDVGEGIAVDGSGNAYVTGRTYSSSFPVGPGYDTSHNGGGDAFVVKLSPSGASLLYSTFLGGSGHDWGWDIAVDGLGNAYMTGVTDSSDFPVGPGYDTSYNGGFNDAFVVKLSPSGASLLYSTFLGGSGDDWGKGIAVDGLGNAYVTGVTDSSDFPVGPGYDISYDGGVAFVVKLSPSGTFLLYSTFLGGSSGGDGGAKIAVDGSGNAYVTGWTPSSNFPVGPGYDTSHNGICDAFVVKLNPGGTSLLYSTFLGGSDYDVGKSIAVDGSGNAYVTGWTWSSNFPVGPGYDTSYNGGYDDAFVVKLSPSGTSLLYSTFLGGSSWDNGWSIAVDGSGNAYVTGGTLSSDFPVGPGYDTSHNGICDAFVVKLAVCDPEQPDICFRPSRDGYSFSNYGGMNYNDYTIGDMRRMFGDAAVCRMVGSVCFPKWAALMWNIRAHWYMNGGHCDGMASTSLRFFKSLDNPTDFQTGANTTHDLQLGNSRRHIAYYFVEQLTDPVKAYKDQVRQNTPSAILDQLRSAMSGGAPDPTTLFVRQAGQGGHAITPYSIEDQGNGVYWVRVYDNNHPDDVNRYVVINTTNDTWSYNLGRMTWSGDATTHTLGIVPISKYAEQPVCSWCNGAMTLNGSPSGQVWLTGQGHLLITDSQGRRIGYVGEQFVNEIPGAHESIVDGGLGVEMEPIYTLPLVGTYAILLDGRTLTQVETVEVTQFGPGYAVSVDDVALGPASQDRLTVAPDGTQLTYLSSGNKEATLTLALDGASESNQLQINGADIGAGQAVTLTADVDNGQLVFSNAQTSGGEYNLDVGRISTAGMQMFVHADLVISATDTHYVDYGAWDGSGSMTVHIDHGSDGTIDETLVLENQVRRVYLPVILLNH